MKKILLVLLIATLFSFSYAGDPILPKINENSSLKDLRSYYDFSLRLLRGIPDEMKGTFTTALTKHKLIEIKDAGIFELALSEPGEYLWLMKPKEMYIDRSSQEIFHYFVEEQHTTIEKLFSYWSGITWHHRFAEYLLEIAGNNNSEKSKVFVQMIRDLDKKKLYSKALILMSTLGSNTIDSDIAMDLIDEISTDIAGWSEQDMLRYIMKVTPSASPRHFQRIVDFMGKLGESNPNYLDVYKKLISVDPKIGAEVSLKKPKILVRLLARELLSVSSDQWSFRIHHGAEGEVSYWAESLYLKLRDLFYEEPRLLTTFFTTFKEWGAQHGVETHSAFFFREVVTSLAIDKKIDFDINLALDLVPKELEGWDKKRIFSALRAGGRLSGKEFENSKLYKSFVKENKYYWLKYKLEGCRLNFLP